VQRAEGRGQRAEDGGQSAECRGLTRCLNSEALPA